MESMTHRPGSIVDDSVLEQPREPILSAAASHSPQGNFLDLLLRLAEWKGFIFKFVLAAAVLAAIVSLIWPKSYTASAKIMPPQQSQSSLASAVMGQLGPLAAMAGNSFGIGKSASDIYIYVLRSRTLADDLIDRFSLMNVYKERK